MVEGDIDLMGMIVQKFGGSSLTNEEKREQAIQHIQSALQEGNRVCVVVSAMGRKGDPYATDTLIDLIATNGNRLNNREWDLLLSCGEVISASVLASMLNVRGVKATVLTGGQAGIITNEDFRNARILTVQPKKILEAFQTHDVVIVTGFQGRTADGDVTTLGRGGSDTTATVLGAALKADFVDIFTDVNGIMTADPRIVEDARQLQKVTYTEICNMAYQGAKVIHPRAVEIAMQANIPIRVRSTFSKENGTLVTNLQEGEGVTSEVRDRMITGIAQVANLTQIQVWSKEGRNDLQARVFKAMADHGISVDFINVYPSGVAYTVFDDQAERAALILRELGYEPELLPHCAKVSAIGAGMAGVPGVMAKIVQALTDENIQILQSADSHTTIWVLVKQDDMNRAVQVLHRTFQLHEY